MICGVPYRGMCVCVYFFRQLCGKAVEIREILNDNLRILAGFKLDFQLFSS